MDPIPKNRGSSIARFVFVAWLAAADPARAEDADIEKWVGSATAALARRDYAKTIADAKQAQELERAEHQRNMNEEAQMNRRLGEIGRKFGK